MQRIRRLVTLAVVVGAAAQLLAQPAGAATRTIPLQDLQPVTMGDGALYWAGIGSGCHGCWIVAKTDVATGVSMRLTRVRGEVSDVFAAGDTVAYSSETSRGTYVMVSRAGGSFRKVASSAKSRGKGGLCESDVIAQAVSAQGAIAWYTVDFRSSRGRRGCRKHQQNQAFVQMTIQYPDGAGTLNEPPRRISLESAYELLGTGDNESYIALNGDHWIQDLGDGHAIAGNRATGVQARIKHQTIFNDENPNISVGPDGEVITQVSARTKTDPYAMTAILHPFSDSLATIVPLRDGSATTGASARFCGTHVLSFATAGQSDGSIVVRDLAGTEQSRIAPPADMPGSSPALLLCDGITVVARYDSDTMDSRFVAIDLPGA